MERQRTVKYYPRKDMERQRTVKCYLRSQKTVKYYEIWEGRGLSSVIQDHRGLSNIILDQIWKGQRTVKDYFYCYYPR